MDTSDEGPLRRYIALLTECISPEQAARIAEQWELICAEEGWLNLSESSLPLPNGSLEPPK